MKDTLFFNRVPKVGSQTIMDLLQRLAVQNDFHFHRDGTQKVETIKLTYYEEVSSTLFRFFSLPSVPICRTWNDDDDDALMGHQKTSSFPCEPKFVSLSTATADFHRCKS